MTFFRFYRNFIFYFIIIVFNFNTVSAQQDYKNFDAVNDTVIFFSTWQYSPTSSNYSSVLNDTTIKWSKTDIRNVNSFVNSKFWIKKEFIIKGTIRDTDFLSLVFTNIHDAFEVYLDGKKLTTNGELKSNLNPGDYGKVKMLVKLGHKLTSPGKHILILRVSNFGERILSPQPGIILGYYSILQRERLNQVFELSVYLGLFFSAFIFSISVYIVGWRDRSFLFFSGFTLFYFLISLWYFLVDNYVIGFSVEKWLTPLFSFGHTFALIILVFFTLAFYDIKLKWIYFVTLAGIGAIFILISGVLGYRLTINLMYVVYSVYSLFIALMYLNKSISGAIPLIIALSISFVYSFFTVMIIIYKINFPQYYILNLFENILFVSLIIIAISRKIQDRNKKYGEALLLSHRLESEMLKKSIQPHFIMNTLLSLKSWLIKDKQKAGKIIDALAAQFRIINRIVNEREILLSEEIELCKIHIELMGYRFDAEYRFEIEGDFDGLKVPPLIFHTLVENALTHSFLPKENGIFYFKVLRGKVGNTFILSNDGSQIKDMDLNDSDEIVEGLGLKYVKTRLEENYNRNWHLDYGIVNDLWEVKINFEN